MTTMTTAKDAKTLKRKVGNEIPKAVFVDVRITFPGMGDLVEEAFLHRKSNENTTFPELGDGPSVPEGRDVDPGELWCGDAHRINTNSRGIRICRNIFFVWDFAYHSEEKNLQAKTDVRNFFE